MENYSGKNKRAGTLLTIGILLLFAFLIFFYMGYVGSASTHFQNQNYNEFACKYMRANNEYLSFSERYIWSAGKVVESKPLETGLGVASCGLELPLVTNNTGNISALIRNYSMSACEYGNNNTFKEFVWVRSLPVNITDGDIDYSTIAPGGPPGMNPCYLIWRINTSYIGRDTLTAKNYMGGGEVSENYFKNGTIIHNTITTLSINYIGQVPTSFEYNILSCVGWCNPVNYVEIWGMPQ